MDDADAVHAEAAREMLQRGDYVTLHVNGIRYLDKAPLLYWLTSASYRIFGFNEFGTRLPLSLLALCALLAAFWLGRDIAGDEAGFYAALILVTGVGPYIYTRFLIPDILIGLWLTLTAILLLRIFEDPKPSRLVCWSLGVVTALDVLTKGLIGAVFPLVILGGYILITGSWGYLRKLRPISTTLVFLVVAVPWHVLAIVRNPPQGAAKGFFWFYFINEQINRYLNKRIPHDYDKVPLWIFWGLILVWLLPWSGYVVAAFRQLPLRWRSIRSQMTKEQRASLLLVIWALVILVFFSFSTRQEYYVLPALPAIAVLTGIWLSREVDAPADTKTWRAGRAATIFIMVLGGIIGVITLFLAITSRPLPPGMDFADALKKATDLYTLSFGHFFDLTPQAMGAFRFPLALTGSAFLLGTGLSWYYRRRLQKFRANLALGVMMIAVLFAVHLALITFSPVLGSKPLATAIKQQMRDGDVIVVDGEQSAASSINFYTGAQMHLLNGRKNNMWFGSLFPDAPPIFEDDASFEKLWQGPRRIFFITFNESGRKRLDQIGKPVFEVVHSGGKAVFSNQSRNSIM